MSVIVANCLSGSQRPLCCASGLGVPSGRASRFEASGVGVGTQVRSTHDSPSRQPRFPTSVAESPIDSQSAAVRQHTVSLRLLHPTNTMPTNTNLTNIRLSLARDE